MADGLEAMTRVCLTAATQKRETDCEHDWRPYYGRGIPGQLPDCMVCNACGATRPYASDGPITPAKQRKEET